VEPKATDIAQNLRLNAELTSRANALTTETLQHTEAGRDTTPWDANLSLIWFAPDMGRFRSLDLITIASK